MSKFSNAVGRVFQGGARAFSRFPAAMFSAIVVAVIASVLIYQDVTINEKLYNSLQMAFAFGAFLGMALAVAVARPVSRPWLVILANLAGIAISAGVFALIYFRSGVIPSVTIARIVAASAIAFLAFLLIISRDQGISDYSQASFMVLKSALIALLYAVVIMGGLSFLAFTVKTLIYSDMSEKIYQYLGVWSMFSWFAFFLGYFPDFRKGIADDHLATAQKHPAFVEVLFAYVMIPIMMAMTVVLLIWSVQILIVGKWPPFSQLTSIFSAYTLSGIFLSIMVSHYIKPIAGWFRRIFPFAAFLFLAFEAYAIFSQVGKSGIKTNEYFISLIWIYVLLTALVMAIWPTVRLRLTGFAAIVLIAAAVLPIVGYQDVPLAAQTRRLQLVLIKNDMLAEGKIQKASAGISETDKAAITDATYYLLRYDDVTKADWFENAFVTSNQFSSVYGFDPAYTDNENINDFLYTYLSLPDGTVKISDYAYAASVSEYKSGMTPTVKSAKGTYTFEFTNLTSGDSPAIKVLRDGEVVLTKDLQEWLDTLEEKYKGNSGKEPAAVNFEDMLLKLEKDGLKVLVVFDRIEINTQISTQTKTYMLITNAVYLSE